MAFPNQSISLQNPLTGVFGNGQVQMFVSSGTFTVPLGVSRVRVRVWGGGGCDGGSGGGFALKEIDLGSTTSVPITIGQGGTAATSPLFNGGSSSFGAYVSATGGNGQGGTAGTGIGGDINHSGGTGSANVGGGGAGSIFGDGGASVVGTSVGKNGGSGGAAATAGYCGGNSPTAAGGYFNTTTQTPVFPQSGFESGFCLDLIALRRRWELFAKRHKWRRWRFPRIWWISGRRLRRCHWQYNWRQRPSNRGVLKC